MHRDLLTQALCWNSISASKTSNIRKSDLKKIKRRMEVSNQRNFNLLSLDYAPRLESHRGKFQSPPLIRDLFDHSIF